MRVNRTRHTIRHHFSCLLHSTASNAISVYIVHCTRQQHTAMKKKSPSRCHDLYLIYVYEVAHLCVIWSHNDMRFYSWKNLSCNSALFFGKTIWWPSIKHNSSERLRTCSDLMNRRFQNKKYETIFFREYRWNVWCWKSNIIWGCFFRLVTHIHMLVHSLWPWILIAHHSNNNSNIMQKRRFYC